MLHILRGGAQLCSTTIIPWLPKIRKSCVWARTDFYLGLICKAMASECLQPLISLITEKRRILLGNGGERSDITLMIEAPI